VVALTSLLLILTPNVPTLVYERCMIKHETTSPSAITHCTCDMGLIDHSPPIHFPKGMYVFQVSPTSCHVFIIL
jgi:hypothetical protein